MAEIRVIIPSVNEYQHRVRALGATFIGTYACTDTIFTLKIYSNLNQELIRIRTYTENNWPTKNVIVTHKKTEDGATKPHNIILKKEFEDLETATRFLHTYYRSPEKQVEYSRKGWEYHLNTTKIYIENVELLGPTAELEDHHHEHLEHLLQQLGNPERVTGSLPNLIKKITSTFTDLYK